MHCRHPCLAPLLPFLPCTVTFPTIKSKRQTKISSQPPNEQVCFLCNGFSFGYQDLESWVLRLILDHRFGVLIWFFEVSRKILATRLSGFCVNIFSQICPHQSHWIGLNVNIPTRNERGLHLGILLFFLFFLASIWLSRNFTEENLLNLLYSKISISYWFLLIKMFLSCIEVTCCGIYL